MVARTERNGAGEYWLVSGVHARGRVLVCGAGGMLGRDVAKHLLAHSGELDVVIGSRNPEGLGIGANSSVSTARVDFDDVDSLLDAFDGCDRLLLISPGSEPTRRRRVEWLTRAVDAAEHCGVGHVVYTSMCGARSTEGITIFGEHDHVERALDASSLGWTVLRNSMYVDQFADSLPLAFHHGKFSVSDPVAAISYVTRADCAYAAYHALVSGFSGRRCLEITGGSAPSRAQLLGFVAEKTGRSVKVMAVDLDELHERLIRAGIWRHVVDSIVELESAVGEGYFASPSDDFRQLTGRHPQSGHDYLQERLEWIIESVSALEVGVRKA